MSEVLAAVPAPLFDRLASLPVQGVIDATLIDSVGLRESLVRELGNLFGARSARSVAHYLKGELTVLDYGLPDLSHLSARAEADRLVLTRVLHMAMASFEPRLAAVEVSVEPAADAPTRAHVRIAAAVRIGSALRRVEFDLALPSGGGSPELRQSAPNT